MIALRVAATTWLSAVCIVCALRWIRSGASLALPWHFRSVARKSSMAVWTTIRDRRRSEQLGDDGAADLRQRGLRRWPVAVHLFPPAPPPSSAGVAGRRRQCRSSARAGAARSKSGPRSRRGRAPASVADVPARGTRAPCPWRPAATAVIAHAPDLVVATQRSARAVHR